MSIELKNISYRYENDGDDASSRLILDGINLTIKKEELTAIMGATGSGKSTLIQHLNLLLHAQSGEIFYEGEDIYAEDFNRKALRANVGLVFQYPEYQLFETDVFTDVCFGPKNLCLTQGEIEDRARKALALVGLSEEDWHRSPFELSGGQKRRAAIAGVLAMQPKYLILDEPAAGLDPKGRRDMLELMRALQREAGIGVVFVSHSMDDVAQYADRIVVLDGGKIRFEGTAKEVFRHRDELESIGLSVPQAAKVAALLQSKGVKLPEDIITRDELVKALS